MFVFDRQLRTTEFFYFAPTGLPPLGFGAVSADLFGGDLASRPVSLYFAFSILYRLSTSKCFNMAPTGLEPVSSALRGQRPNQLDDGAVLVYFE